MTSILGKRKRRRVEQKSEAEQAANEQDVVDFQELLRKHFEAQFEPLEVKTKPAAVVHGSPGAEAQEDEASDWMGLSEDDDGQVEITVHDTRHQADTVRGSELRAFMVHSSTVCRLSSAYANTSALPRAPSLPPSPA